MGLSLQRGYVEEVVQSQKDGAADCRISDCRIKMPPELADIVEEGDNILVAGELKKDVLQAYAVKNLGKGKTAYIDSTFFILLMGAGACSGILFGVFGLESVSNLIGPVEDLLSIVGFIVAAVALSRVVLINRANNLIKYSY